MAYGDYKMVHSPADAPKGPHWAVLTFEEHNYDSGYRDNSGQPEYSTRTDCTYYAFTKKEAWEEEVRKLTLDKSYSPKKFVAMYVVPASINVEVKVDIK